MATLNALSVPDLLGIDLPAQELQESQSRLERGGDLDNDQTAHPLDVALARTDRAPALPGLALASAAVVPGVFIPVDIVDPPELETLVGWTSRSESSTSPSLRIHPALEDSTLSHVPTHELFDLDLPADQQAPPDPYVQRFAQDRISIVERFGGSKKTENAVAAALLWLARHQSRDGRWSGADFDESCGQCGGETEVEADHALTGLSLLAFMGAGYTHNSKSPYRDNVERGLNWLRARQLSNGDLRGDETMYSHGIATIALSEAYGMTDDATLADPVQRAVNFVHHARNTRRGGWRYDPGQVGDTSVMGWQAMALKSANLNGLSVPGEDFQTVRKWLALVDRGSAPGLYAYKPGRGATPSMTAEGMFALQLLGTPRDDPRMANAEALLMRNLPDWDADPNTYYWYYATLALFQHQGDSWKLWNDALTRTLLANQRHDDGAAGSWNPDGEWADVGGRVYQTVLCTMMLEVYYRYLPLISIDRPEDAVGEIVGRVTDAATGKPLSGATIHLDLPDRPSIKIQSDASGRYQLFVPDVPDFFALTATQDGFVPDSRNVDAAMLFGSVLNLDFGLRPESEDVVAIEAVPEVHHLGDNRFSGSINSQFQHESEGAEFWAEFSLKSSQVPPYVQSAEVVLLAKGVQRSHKIQINGRTLDRRLDEAPEDGSFGEFVAEFDARYLRAGRNRFGIIAKPSSSDIDDFEFVNVRIRLSP